VEKILSVSSAVTGDTSSFTVTIRQEKVSGTTFVLPELERDPDTEYLLHYEYESEVI